MTKFIELIGLLPKYAQVLIVGLLVGGVGFAAHEERYMTVGQFTKSYVLDLKRSIREIESDLRDQSLDDRTRKILQEQLELLLDDLCYELPNDPSCKRR